MCNNNKREIDFSVEERRAEQRRTEESLVGSSDGVQANENSHDCNEIGTRDLKKGRETATG
jgi:hypothetical protein